MKSITNATKAPSKYYIRDINLEVQVLRPALVLRRLPKGRMEIFYTDNWQLARLAPRGRYGVRKGIDLEGIPEMTQKVTDEFLENNTEIMVADVYYESGRKAPERWVTLNDYQDSLPRWSDKP